MKLPWPWNRPATKRIGYYEETTWTDPQDQGYVVDLDLPPGKYIVIATARIRNQSGGPAEIECSLFRGTENVSLNRSSLAPSQADTIAATTHVDTTTTINVQLACSCTSGPWELSQTIAALPVDELVQHGGQ